MINIMLTIFSLGFSGAMLTIILYIFKKYLKQNLSMQLLYIIHILALLRVVIPLSSKISVLFFLPIVGADASNIASNYYGLIAILFVIWLIGFSIVLYCQLKSYSRYKQKLKKNSSPVTSKKIITVYNYVKASLGIVRRIPVRHTDIPSPMLVGVISPIIYLPQQHDWKDSLHIILEHEFIHYKRKDILVKWLSIFALAVHWYNPFVYHLKSELEKLCELSCDERVLKNKSDEDKFSYGDAIIGLLSTKKKHSAFSYGFSANGKMVRDRLLNISDGQADKSTKVRVIFAVFAMFLIILALLGSYPINNNYYNVEGDVRYIVNLNSSIVNVN